MPHLRRGFIAAKVGKYPLTQPALAVAVAAAVALLVVIPEADLRFRYFPKNFVKPHPTLTIS
ncbi:MAG TPA: hypothetical protein VIX90_09960 [Edaphobacter sp.]